MPYTTTKVQALKSYPTYQFYAKAGSRSVDTDCVFRICILEALKWIRSRLQDNHDIPRDLYAPEPEQYADFSCEDITSFSINSGFQIDVIYIDTAGIWSFRIAEPDMGANLGTPQERLPVRGRTFTTEIAFRRQEEYVEVGVRTICSEPSDNMEGCEVFRPRVVKALTENPLLELKHSGWILDGSPLVINSKAELERFFDIFSDEARSMPLVVIADSAVETVKPVNVEPVQAISSGLGSYSLSGLAKKNDSIQLTISPELKGYKTDLKREDKPKKNKPKQAERPKSEPAKKKLPVFDYAKLAHTLTGYAIVVFAEEKFFGQIEKKTHISVKHGDIIIIPRQRPSERYSYTQYSEDMQAFYQKLRGGVIDMSIRGVCGFEGVCFYSDAKLKEFHSKRKQADTLEEKCELYKQEKEELKSQIKQLTQQRTDMNQTAESLRLAQKKIESLKNDLEAEREKNRALADDARLKEAAYTRSSGMIAFYRQQVETVSRFPADKKDVCDWIEDSFSGELIVAPRAQSELRKYYAALDINTLCDGIVYLDAYAKYRRQELSEDMLNLYAQRRNWEVQGCGSAAMNMRRDDYTVNCGGKKYLLDMHIKRGRQAEELIRIYFCWDEEVRKIVIGSMPGHLATVSDSH